MKTGSLNVFCTDTDHAPRTCNRCWKEDFPEEVPVTETSVKLGNAPLTQEAMDYIAKLFPCEPPCDSYGVCDNCCEAAIFGAGYNFGYRAGMSGET